jgi:phosphocarrier protein
MADKIAQRVVRAPGPLGLHARPAAKISQAAQTFTANIVMSSEAGSVDAKSILDILSLSAGPGTSVTIHATGPDAETAVNTLSDIISAGI